MLKRILLALLAVVVALFSLIGYVFIRDSRDSQATTLAACVSVPSGLPEELRGVYIRICSSNIREREEGLRKLPYLKLQSQEMAAFLPLLSEIMGSNDYVTDDMRRFYLAQFAAERMAFAGTSAVPFFVKSLQSRKTVEIQAALSGVGKLHSVLMGKTNEWRAACITLLPYVSAQTTNTLFEQQKEARAFFGPIRYKAKVFEGELKEGAQEIE